MEDATSIWAEEREPQRWRGYLPFMMSAKSSQSGFDVLCPSHGGSEHLGQIWEPAVNCESKQDTFDPMVQGRKSAAFVPLDLS